MDSCRTTRLVRFSASVFAIVSMFAGVIAAGCGGEATYSEEHADFITYDCQQTAPCDPVFSIRSDSVAECIKDTSNKLDRGSDAVRANYEARFTRCAAASGCAYFGCAMDTMLYSIVNEQKLRYDCMQQIVCKIQQGQPMMPTDNDACFQQLSSTLDFASVPDKTSYEQRVARCAAFVGCDYVNCK